MNKIFNIIKSTPKHVQIITIGSLYCTLRPISNFKHGINIYENGNYNNYPLLTSEKIFIMSIGLITGIPLFPYFKLYDIYNFELNKSNRKIKLNNNNHDSLLDFIIH